MSVTSGSSMPHLIHALASEADRNAIARKLIVVPTFGMGRELLRRLSLERMGWVGFEITTPHTLALQLARLGLDSASLKTLDAFEQQSILDEALDLCISSGDGELGNLSEGVGLREKVYGAISALRMAGIEVSTLESARLKTLSKRLFLLRMLKRYERLLYERRQADSAVIFQLALEALETEGNQLPSVLGADRLVLTPGLTTRGLIGRLLAGLQTRGASVLETDPVVGIDIPDGILWNRHTEPEWHSYLHAPAALPADITGPEVEMFRAASITDELREVLRRIVERGLRWDEVEIIATEPTKYGSALHSVSTQLGIPVTYAVGLPIERTRTGRVVKAYLDWIEEGFQADLIRRLLEAGDLRPREAQDGPSALDLARRFRFLRIGWGRERYFTQIRSAIDGIEWLRPRRLESEQDFEQRCKKTRNELEALRGILFPPLKATPRVPDRFGQDGRPVSPAELAQGLRSFLRRVPIVEGPDSSAHKELDEFLERIEATLQRRTNFRAAVTILRRRLKVHVQAYGVGLSESSTESRTTASSGGHLHLSDLEHGGVTGRRAVFFVGADTEHLPGKVTQDPVLVDGDRRILGEGLPTSTELLRERVFSLAALIARLKCAHLTMSYAAWDAVQSQIVGPSTTLLQLLRLSQSKPHLTFEDLGQALGDIICRVPKSARPLLDVDDIWLSGLGSGEVMQRGEQSVLEAFPGLNAGVTKERERGGEPGYVHGAIVPRPSALDPRRNEDIVLSPSRLEGLGTCPLRYLHSSVLRLIPPDDYEFNPDRWLDPRRKGRLLHKVFEHTLSKARESNLAHSDRTFEGLALERLQSEVEQAKKEVPAPGEDAVGREISGLEDDVRSFVRMVRKEGAPWEELEFSFGMGGEAPVSIEVEGGSIQLRGIIDRLDCPGGDLELEGIRVIDYKTGRNTKAFRQGTRVFNGGRRLQLGLYALAVEERLSRQVETGEYHYPTRGGQNELFSFRRDQLVESVGSLVGHMLQGVADGRFIPTEDKEDCSYCDYSEVCRVEKSDYGGVTSSPLAEWSEKYLKDSDLTPPALTPLKKVREFEDDG